ncbi:BTAD domain-containing putative transcriptional regulator [Nocardia sp. NPDC056100]|uniref:BTAD domain-containing putative transcriptional regulator n=1 Tax=Nocardia sp. NPDC056100 TaxID=3345712 RepID=UPI0035DE5738
MATIRINLLNGVEVLRDDQPVPSGPPQRCALLAALALRRGRWVPATVLLDGLYDGDVPASGTGLIQTHISALRRVLEPDRAPRAEPRVLLSGHGGYQLRITDDQVDAGIFDALVARAEHARAQGDWQTADQLYTHALPLCSGEPLAGLPGPAASAQRAVLRERYLSALEESLFVASMLGRTDRVLDRLRPLVGEHPLRERAAELLMRALVRQGRRSEALEVYTRTRRALIDTLGVEPGNDLRTLQTSILAGQPIPSPTRHPSSPDLFPAVLSRRPNDGTAGVTASPVPATVASSDESARYRSSTSEAIDLRESPAPATIRPGVLGAAEIAALAERVLGIPGGRFALDIHRATGGSPVLVTALLKDLALLDDPPCVPEYLANGNYTRAVRRQLDQLAPATVRALRAIAVLHEYAAPPEVVAAACGQSDSEFRDSCGTLMAHGITAPPRPRHGTAVDEAEGYPGYDSARTSASAVGVHQRPVGGGAAHPTAVSGGAPELSRLRHALPANTLRRLCTREEVQGMLAAAAQRAAVLTGDSRVAARYLRELSGERWAEWVPTLVDAGAEAVRALELPEAIGYLEVAQRVCAPEQRDEIGVRLGLVKQWTDPVAARAYFERALMGQRAAKVAPTALIPLAWTLVTSGQTQDAEALLDEVIAETAGHDPEAARTLRASRWMVTGLTSRAWNAYLARTRAEAAPDAVTEAVLAIDDLVAVRISAHEARSRFEAAAGGTTGEYIPPELLGIQAHIALWTDEVTLAGQLTGQGDDRYFGMLDTYRLMLHTEVLLRQARYAEAARTCALVAVAAPASVRRPAGLVALYAAALLGAGRIEEADRLLEPAHIHANSESWEWITVTYVRAMLCAAQGRSREAAGHFLDCGRRLAAWQQHNPSHLPWRSSAALQLSALGELDEARRLAAEELELAIRLNTPVALGRAWRAVALAAADQTTSESLCRAVAYLECGESVPELLAALIDLADTHAATGHTALARTTLRRARALADSRAVRVVLALIDQRLSALSSFAPAGSGQDRSRPDDAILEPAGSA